MYTRRRRSIIFLCLILIFVFIPFSRYCYGGINGLEHKYELTYDTESHKDIVHSKTLSGSSIYTFDINGSERSYNCASWLFYKPSPIGDFSHLTYVKEPLVVFLERGSIWPKEATHYRYEPGDTVVVEAQTDGIGIYSTTIFAERDGQWIEVAGKSMTAETVDEGTYLITEYTVDSDDRRIKAVNHFELQCGDKSVSKDKYYILDVGNEYKYLSHMNFTSIAYGGSALLLIIVVTLVIVIIRKKAIGKNNQA